MRRFHVLPGMLLALLASFASAQSSFTVTPLRVDLAPKTPAAIVDVINTSAAPLTLQVQQRAWVQSDGRDSQADTRDLILSPDELDDALNFRGVRSFGADCLHGHGVFETLKGISELVLQRLAAGNTAA